MPARHHYAAPLLGRISHNKLYFGSILVPLLNYGQKLNAHCTCYAHSVVGKLALSDNNRMSITGGFNADIVFYRL